MAGKKSTPRATPPRRVLPPVSADPLDSATMSVIRARTLMEVLEELVDRDALKIDGRANDDVLVTTLSTIRGLLQDAERSIDRGHQLYLEVRRG